MPKEIQVKNYKIIFNKKPLKQNITFTIEVRALNEKNALEQAYSIIGSRHALSRNLLQVKSVKEVSDQDIKNPIIQTIARNKDIKVPTKN